MGYSDASFRVRREGRFVVTEIRAAVADDDTRESDAVGVDAIREMVAWAAGVITTHLASIDMPALAEAVDLASECWPEQLVASIDASFHEGERGGAN